MNDNIDVRLNKTQYELAVKAIYLARGAAEIAGNNILADNYRSLISLFVDVKLNVPRR